MSMLEVYYGLLIFGIIFTFVTIIFDDLLGNLLDGVFDVLSVDGLDFINPMVIIGGTTVFGGAGVFFTKYTFFSPTMILVLSGLIALLVSILVYFFYVKPMKNAENSTAYSIRETIGKIGEVTVPIPANGFGEVMLKIGLSNTNHIAASFDKEVIHTGDRVVVIEVKDNTLYVSRFENI